MSRRRIQIIKIVKLQKGAPGSAGVLFKETSPAKTINTGGITLEEVKADPVIADVISKHHSSHSDDQDLSGYVLKIVGYSLVPNTEIAKIHAAHSDDQDLSGLVIKVSGKSLVLDSEISKIHAAHSDDQDLSGYVLKVEGKDLSANDLTNLLKAAYDAAVTHSGSTHAPANALTQQQIMRLI
jgi:hypothetical protein